LAAALIAAASLILTGRGAALSVDAQSVLSADELTPQEKRGKQFYQKGESASGEARALLSGDLDLPAASFPCSNCHGLKGEGGSEGGLQPPPIQWASLKSPRVSALTRNERPPYNEATLARAISSGIDSSGARLHPGMPRYLMTPAQMADLVAYLKKIGKEADPEPGLSVDGIRIGAALPMTGPLMRIGEDVKSALGAYFNEINSEGGINGRRFELIVRDSRGDGPGTFEATRQLIEQDQVFALVGSFEPRGSDAANELLKRAEVPLVGPLTLSPRAHAEANRFVFYLLPSSADQAAALVDFIGSVKARPKDSPAAARLAVVYVEGDLERDALDGLRSQARLYSMQLVREQAYRVGQFSAAAVVGALGSIKPDYVFFFGAGDDFTRLALEMGRAGLKSGLLTSAIMVGRAAFNVPQAVAALTHLSYPAAMPDKGDLTEFQYLMKKAGASAGSPAYQALAFASAKILVEATKESGTHLTRNLLITALEQLREFKTGVAPPVTFGPDRRIGATGSYIVGIDLTKKEFVPLTGMIVPKKGNQ
jgi:ABC-type branched-subunit amino acid transport system substrate-binding protein